MSYDVTYTGPELNTTIGRVINQFEFPSKTQTQLDAMSLDAGVRAIYYNSTTDAFVKWTGTAFVGFANARTSIDGDARGTAAIDFQYARTADTQVASGERSFVAAGRENTASGDYSLAAGYGNTASGESASAIGRSNAATGNSSLSTGRANTASGDFSQASGYEAKARLRAQTAQASASFAAAGDAQYSRVVVQNTTTNASATTLFLGGAASGEYITLEDDTLYNVRAMVTARNEGADEQAAYEIKGVIRRATGAASVALLGTPTVTALYESVAGWDAALAANASDGSMDIKATGESGKTIRWAAMVEWVEVSI